MKILMLLDNPFTNDRRVMREAVSLVEAGFTVNLICMAGKDLPDHEDYRGIYVWRLLSQELNDIKQPSLFREAAKKVVEKIDFDIIHCHDQLMLHLAGIIKTKAKPGTVLFYDSHELFHAWPLNVDADHLWLRIKSWIVRKMLIRREHRNRKFIDHLITVNQSLADDLFKYLQLRKEPVVVRNVPEIPIRFEKNTILRRTLNIPKTAKLLVFIGGNIYPKTLNLEQVIDEFGNQQGVHLAFICSDRPGKRAIEDYVRQKNFSNIHFHGLILPEEIPAWLSSADAGLVPTWNKNDLSYWYALDNKLFEYMMSEIPVLATLQPEYKRIVDDYKVGVCVNPDEEDAYLKGFREILSRREEFVIHCRQAKKTLNWENEKLKLLGLYQSFQDKQKS